MLNRVNSAKQILDLSTYLVRILTYTVNTFYTINSDGARRWFADQK